MLRLLFCRLAALAMVAAATPTFAVTDRTDDLLPTYVGPRTAELDFNAAEAGYNTLAGGFFLTTSHVESPGKTPGLSVTWGIDRGAGTPGLFAGDPPIGPSIRFDAVLVVRPLGEITLAVFNPDGPPTVTVLDSRAPFNDGLLTGFIPFDLLPSRGFALADYRFNAWSRGGSGNAGIADLALKDGTFGAVPEPASWAMMVAGFGLIGAAARRRPIPQVTA